MGHTLKAANAVATGLKERFYELLESEPTGGLTGKLVYAAESKFRDSLTPEQIKEYDAFTATLAAYEADRTERFFRFGYLEGLQASTVINKI